MSTVSTQTTLGAADIIDVTLGKFRYTLKGGDTDVVQELDNPEASFQITKSGTYTVVAERLLADGTPWQTAVVSDSIDVVIQQGRYPTAIAITLS